MKSWRSVVAVALAVVALALALAVAPHETLATNSPSRQPSRAPTAWISTQQSSPYLAIGVIAPVFAFFGTIVLSFAIT